MSIKSITPNFVVFAPDPFYGEPFIFEKIKLSSTLGSNGGNIFGTVISVNKSECILLETGNKGFLNLNLKPHFSHYLL